MRTWSDAETSQLLAWMATGMTLEQVAERAGRSLESVGQKWRRMKPKATRHSRWTPDMDAMLIKLWPEPVGISHIAGRIGISTTGCKRRAKRLGLGERG
jgi:hypothetical protein